jgi:hypothetical protein
MRGKLLIRTVLVTRWLSTRSSAQATFASRVQMLVGDHFGKCGIAFARLHLSVTIAEYLVHLGRMFFNIFCEKQRAAGKA